MPWPIALSPWPPRGAAPGPCPWPRLGLPPSPSLPLGFFWGAGPCTAQKYREFLSPGANLCQWETDASRLSVGQCGCPSVWLQLLGAPVPHSGNQLISQPCAGSSGPPVSLLPPSALCFPGSPPQSSICTQFLVSGLTLGIPFQNCCDDWLRACVQHLRDAVARSWQ